MSHQFPELYFLVSERLSHILDNSGYSPEARNRKVMAANQSEMFFNIAYALRGGQIRRYVFGSRGEGSTGSGLQSDRDYLCQSNTTKVVTDLSQCDPKLTNYLMVKDIHTHPGYVKLQKIQILPDKTPVKIYMDTDNTSTALDPSYRSVATNTIHSYNGIVSGPACHFHNDQKELSYDIVHAFRCSQWPQEGNEWFQRRRLHGWPTPIQIENARKYGCFVTPVGHPHSPERLVEWRLSYSITERDLVRYFEDTTMKVYILLKMIRKTYIEPVIGDAFSSYHCKVCMLWMREKMPRSLWSNTNILQCLVLCIKQLYEWATAGFCPDYFIVTNNIYDRNIIGAIRNTLVQILRNLLASNCTFLLEIQFCNLGQHISDQISRFDYCINPMINEEIVNHMLILEDASKCRYSILHYIPQHYLALIDYLGRFLYASKYLPYITDNPLKHAMMIMWSQLGFHIATLCKENAHNMSHEQVDYLVTLASLCLSFGINTDATSVRLKLCGLGMEHGNHNLIETCLQHISDCHIKYIYSFTINVSVILDCNNKPLIEKLLRTKYNMEELLQTQTSFSVIYLPTEMSITPKPLRMEMFRSVCAPSEFSKDMDSWYNWGVVDSLICLYFFQYLNFYRQRKERHKDVAMYNMIHVIRTEPDISHRDTAFNLLGYSFMQENQLTNAFRCFTQSMNLCPYHNAAKFYMGIIFSRIQANAHRTC
ncbi:hypothetical protein ACJMK2_018719 [Sinanodonta woodiana]|uniref:Uncharacterized protein n=1 Tax=Sinanodonta woodiana TaxID=1069815 RepID=A0ABD3UFR8_SINWO